jgi:hypothetical protein
MQTLRDVFYREARPINTLSRSQTLGRLILSERTMRLKLLKPIFPRYKAPRYKIAKSNSLNGEKWIRRPSIRVILSRRASDITMCT